MIPCGGHVGSLPLRPDPSFYPSPRRAGRAPAERHAYVVAFDPRAALGLPGDQRPDELAVVGLDPAAPGYGRVLASTPVPTLGDELHLFGGHACSSALCPYAPPPHVEPRSLVVPGLRSSRSGPSASSRAAPSPWSACRGGRSRRERRRRPARRVRAARLAAGADVRARGRLAWGAPATTRANGSWPPPSRRSAHLHLG
ncbi:MAG: selenium-binding family protein [Polyangiaceae bacterium]|nr:selenium-binding family protein [Polyangiaceae bacterium]